MPLKGERRASECWTNTVYDNFQDRLLRPDKTKSIITMETILRCLRPVLRGIGVLFECLTMTPKGL